MLLKSIRDLIYELTGNYYSEDRLHSLKQKIVNLLMDKGVISTEHELDYKIYELMKKREIKEELIDHITINETSFFRHKYQLQTFSEHFLDKIIKDPVSKILSAGCSTGEEPYTLAMMIIKKNPLITGKRVIGIDISKKVLNIAQKGEYPIRSINYIPEEYRIFVKTEGKMLKIKDIVKNIIDFKQANLIENNFNFKSTFSAVFFRNVLIYFTLDKKRKALMNIHSALRNRGILVLAPTEKVEQENFDLFKPIKVGKFVFYEKV